MGISFEGKGFPHTNFRNSFQLLTQIVQQNADWFERDFSVSCATLFIVDNGPLKFDRILTQNIF